MSKYQEMVCSDFTQLELNYTDYLARAALHLPDTVIGDTVNDGELSIEEFKHHLKQRSRIPREMELQNVHAFKRTFKRGDLICTQNTVAGSPASGNDGKSLGVLHGVYRIKQTDSTEYGKTFRYEYGLRLLNPNDDLVHLPLKLVITDYKGEVCSIQYYDPATVDLSSRVPETVPTTHLTFGGYCARNKYWGLYFNAFIKQLVVKDSLFQPLARLKANEREYRRTPPVAISKHCEDALTYLNNVHYLRVLFGQHLEDFPPTSRILSFSQE